MSRQVQRETLVDLVEAFTNIGLSESTSERNEGPIRSEPEMIDDDYALTADRLRRYYIMSRELSAGPSSDAR